MSQNRGKQFELVVRRAFEKVPDISIDRLHDQTTGFIGSSNICDFIVYRKPYEFYFECKSVHGNTLPFRNITETQWNGLLEKSKIKGVFAGVLCWWVDMDITAFVPIQFLEWQRGIGRKSLHYSLAVDAYFENWINCTKVQGKKKRVFFEYDMEVLLDEIPTR